MLPMDDPHGLWSVILQNIQSIQVLNIDGARTPPCLTRLKKQGRSRGRIPPTSQHSVFDEWPVIRARIHKILSFF